MIRSMTGFGQASFQVQGTGFEVEIRSVNHRYLDLRVRLPRGLAALEPPLREQVQSRIARGKVDLTVRAAPGSMPAELLDVDLAAAEHYLRAAGELRERHGIPGALDVATLLALPGVARLTECSLPGEALREGLTGALAEAIDAADAMRAAEGQALARELAGRLDRVAELAAALESRAGLVQQAVRDRLRKRAEELRRETGLLDEARLHQEVVLAADRLDITEELVRLRSHVQQFRSILDESVPGHPAGRRLGFLLQEMTREANTVGSKAVDAPVAQLVVELKTDLERLREQVQNVE